MKRKIYDILFELRWQIAGALLFLAAWGFVLRAENPGLMADDSGETVASAMGLGIAHPPGYPLFSLIGRLASGLPLGTPAFRLNLLAGGFVLLALLFTVLTCLQVLRWGTRKLSAGWIAALVGMTVVSALGCRSLLAYALTAKGGVYTLTFLFGAVFLWWRVKSEGGETSETSSWTHQGYGVLFLWSVGMANHWETQLLWLPFLFAWIRRKNISMTYRSAWTVLAFIGIGCSIYLVLPIRAQMNPGVDWGHPVNLKQFLWVLLRGPYTGIETETREFSSYVGKTAMFFRQVAWHWWPGWILLAGIGGAWMWKVRRTLATDLFLFYGPVVLGVLVVPNLTRETFPLVLAYLVSTQGLLALGGFCGIAWILTRLDRSALWIRVSLCSVLLLAGIGWAVRTFRLEAKTHYAYADDFALNVLKGLPQGALLCSEGDQFVMPLFYYQTCMGKRKDVVHMPVVFLNSPWGFEQARRRWPNPDQWNIPLAGTQERLRFILSMPLLQTNPSTRVFYSLNRGLLDQLNLNMDQRFLPFGLVYEVVEKSPSAAEASASIWDMAQRQRMRSFQTLTSRGQVDIVTSEFYRYYANQYVVAGNALNQSGMLADAMEYYLKAIGIFPFTAEAYSNMAVVCGKEGLLEMAQTLCQMANRINPEYPGAYENLGNVYALMGMVPQAIEAYRRALTLKPGSPETLENLRKAEEQGKVQTRPPAGVFHPGSYYFGMGNQNARENRLLLAEIAYRTAEQFGYTYPDLYNNLGVVLAQLQKNPEAEAAFLKAIERDARFVDVYKNYGLLLLNLARRKEAQRVIEKGLALSPKNQELLYLQSQL